MVPPITPMLLPKSRLENLTDILCANVDKASEVKEKWMHLKIGTLAHPISSVNDYWNWPQYVNKNKHDRITLSKTRVGLVTGTPCQEVLIP